MEPRIVKILRCPSAHLTQADIDRLQAEYFTYAHILWERVNKASVSDNQAAILYKAILSPFQYWLQEQIETEKYNQVKQNV